MFRKLLVSLSAVVVAVLFWACLAGAAKWNNFPANPCLVNDSRFQSAYGGCYDSSTGLVWSMNQGAAERSNSIWDYPGATNYAANLVEGGYTGWRIPTLAEMQAVAGAPAQIHLDVFVGYGDAGKWSSTAGKRLPGGCTSSKIFALGSGATDQWSNGVWGTKCGSATDFVCVRKHLAGDPQ